VDRSRIGITVSKRVGGAVVRNRIKRRVREVLRHRYACLEPGWDLVVVVRPEAANATFAEIAAALESVLRRAGVLRTEPPCGDSPKP
jgi:ribonuclease P protein component